MKIHLSLLNFIFLYISVFASSNSVAGERAVIVPDPSKLELASGSAMVVDLQNNQVLFSSNPDVIVPIASITKLMTAVVVLDAKQPLDEVISVAISDTKELKGVFSRVRVNSQLSRKEMLRLALMSSENRAAASLGHHYPGGHAVFVAAMNAKAKALGMQSSRFVEPTGLSGDNVSTANDLIRLLIAAQQYPLISELSTTRAQVAAFHKPNYTLGFRNTNRLIHNVNWNIQVTKTGFTDEAGHCLVMLTVLANRPVAVVLLDAFGKSTHFADANRLRRWMETGKGGPVPQVAKRYKKQKNLELLQTQVAPLPQ